MKFGRKWVRQSLEELEGEVEGGYYQIYLYMDKEFKK